MMATQEFRILDDNEEGEIILLHYIGKRYYTVASFTKEALKYGVSRALPARFIKKLHWGDIIYTAFHEKDKQGEYALVFGYFVVQGINVSNSLLQEAIKNDKRLKVVGSASGGGRVVRGCGSYMVEGTTYVDNELSELVEIVEDNARKLNTHVKMMVTGRFVPIEPVVLRGAKFARAILKVKVPKEFLFWFRLSDVTQEKTSVNKKTVAYLKDYNLGKPSKRRRRKIEDRLYANPLDKWLEGTQ